MTEIIGDSIRQALDFIGSKISKLELDSTIFIIGKYLEDIRQIKYSRFLSRICISKNELSYRIFYDGRDDLSIFFITLKNARLIQKYTQKCFCIFINPDDDFDSIINDKSIVLSVKSMDSDYLNNLRDKYSRNYKIIQLGLPETWIIF